MAEKAGKAAFKKGADRNRTKMEAAIRSLMRVGGEQVPALNARLLLERIHRMNPTFTTDKEHERVVGEIVRAKSWTFQGRPKS